MRDDDRAKRPHAYIRSHAIADRRRREPEDRQPCGSRRDGRL